MLRDFAPSMGPLWVKSAIFTLGLPLPVYPRQRTLSDRTAWSGSCQKRSHGVIAGRLPASMNLFSL